MRDQNELQNSWHFGNQGVLEESIRVDPVKEKGRRKGSLQRPEAQEDERGDMETLNKQTLRVVVAVVALVISVAAAAAVLSWLSAPPRPLLSRNSTSVLIRLVTDDAAVRRPKSTIVMAQKPNNVCCLVLAAWVGKFV